MVDALIVGWLKEKQLPARRYEPTHDGTVWKELDDAKAMHMAGFVGWSFRGLSESVSAAYAHCVLTRIEKGDTTVVSCSADPGLLVPKWECDRPLIDAMRKPSILVRCYDD